MKPVKTEDYLGKHFGMLEVLSRLPSKDGQSYFLCRCHCGAENCKGNMPVRAGHLQSGNSKSCGGLRYYSRRKRPFEHLYNQITRFHFNLTKEKIFLTYEEFVELTKEETCFYCGEPVEWAKYGDWRRYNLDRKDNDKGYIRKNVVVCCKTCNYAKGNRYTFEEWVAMTQALLEVRKQNAS